MAWNPHKMLMASLQCSAFLVRDKSVRNTFFTEFMSDYRNEHLSIIYLFFLLSEPPPALPLCSGLLPLPAGQVLRRELRHGGQVGPVQQEAGRLQVLAHVEGFGNQRAGAEGE